MPYLIPSRTPLTPEQVERGFDYLLTLQMGGGAAVAGRAEADPESAFVLLRLAVALIHPARATEWPTRSGTPLATRTSVDYAEALPDLPVSPELPELQDFARPVRCQLLFGDARTVEAVSDMRVQPML